jgi:hypothetical protein
MHTSRMESGCISAIHRHLCTGTQRASRSGSLCAALANREICLHFPGPHTLSEWVTQCPLQNLHTCSHVQQTTSQHLIFIGCYHVYVYVYVHVHVYVFVYAYVYVKAHLCCPVLCLHALASCRPYKNMWI